MSHKIGPLRNGNIALIAGIAWFLQGAASVILPDPTWVLDITMIAPMILTFFAVRVFLNAQSAGATRLGRIGQMVMAVTAIVIVPGQIGAAAELSWLNWLAFPVGALGLTVGLVLTGIATLRAKEFPRWSGILLIASEFLAVLTGLALSPISPIVNHGDYTGAMAHGVVWLLISRRLLGHHSVQPLSAEWGRELAPQP